MNYFQQFELNDSFLGFFMFRIKAVIWFFTFRVLLRAFAWLISVIGIDKANWLQQLGVIINCLALISRLLSFLCLCFLSTKT